MVVTFLHFPDAGVDVNLDAVVVIHQYTRAPQDVRPQVELELAHQSWIGLRSETDCAILRSALEEHRWRPSDDIHAVKELWCRVPGAPLFTVLAEMLWGRAAPCRERGAGDPAPPEVVGVEDPASPWVRLSSGHLGIPIPVRVYYHPINDDGLCFHCHGCGQTSRDAHVAVYVGSHPEAVVCTHMECLPELMRFLVGTAVQNAC